MEGWGERRKHHPIKQTPSLIKISRPTPGRLSRLLPGGNTGERARDTRRSSGELRTFNSR